MTLHDGQPPLSHHRKREGTRLNSRAPSTCTSSSLLYSYPLSADTLPVYESITLTWDPSCVEISTDTIDLYLNVQQDQGLVAVHEWTDVDYSTGRLETQLKPNWWNASTGQGSVQAQLGIVPSGQPIWNTPAPSGPLFTVTYNGSYPSVTDTAPTTVYTGPSVESVADRNSSSNSSTPTGGKLGAAIGVPLIVVALLVGAYVLWNRFKKRPEKKRFSQVVDQRMSMISQGTWQPRPSMAMSRPGSIANHRPSGSMYSTANRHSYFADPNHHQHHRNSTFSTGGGGSPLRPPQPAEMRQIGHGDRISRVSFAGGESGAGGRPSFTSSRNGTGGGGGHGKSSSVYTRSSLHQSQLRGGETDNITISQGGSSPPLNRSIPYLHHHQPQEGGGSSPALTSSTSSSSLASSRFEDPISRSGTREELRDSPSVQLLSSSTTKTSPPIGTRGGGGGGTMFGHGQKSSVGGSSLRNELGGLPAIQVVRDGQLAYQASSSSSDDNHQGDPFVVPALPPPRSPSNSSLNPTSVSNRPKLSPLSTSMTTNNNEGGGGYFDSMMPRSANRASQILSPDQALASYSVQRSLSPLPQPNSVQQQQHSEREGLGMGKKMGSFNSVKSGLGKMWSAGGLHLKRGKSSNSILREGGGGEEKERDRREPSQVVEEQEEDTEEKCFEETTRAKSPFDDPTTPPLPPVPAQQPYSRDRRTIASQYSQDVRRGEEEDSSYGEKRQGDDWNGGHAF